MNWTRFALVLLALDALVFVALGVWFLAQPHTLSVVGLDASDPVARTELRATYGGFELGLGLFLILCLWRGRRAAAWLEAGVWAATLSVGGFGCGRVLGLLLDQPPEPGLLPTLLAIEGVTVFLGGLALVGLRRSAAAEGGDPRPARPD